MLELIGLPKCNSEKSENIFDYADHFDEELFWGNVQIILNVDPGQIDNRSIRSEFIYWRARLETEIESSGGMISKLSGSGESTGQFVGSSFIGSIVDFRGSSEIKQVVADRLHAQGEPYLTLSSSHLNTLHALEGIQQATGGFYRPWVIMPDLHTDYYISRRQKSARHYIESGDVSYLPEAKSNFIIHLLERNVISGVTIVGPGMGSIDAIYQGEVNRDLMVEVIRRFPGRIQHVPADCYFDQIDSLQPRAQLREEFFTEYRHALERASALGASTFVLSIDLDTLRTRQLRYASSQYSPWSIILAMGLQDLTKALVSAHNPDQLASMLVSAMKKVRFPKVDVEAAKNFPIMANHQGHLPLSAIGQMVEELSQHCSVYGGQIGVPGKRGSLYVGDLVEIGNFDYKGYLARAAKALIGRIDIVLAAQKPKNTKKWSPRT